MQWIELMATEQDKCRNMDSVNPLKLINCTDLSSEPGDLTYDYLSPGFLLSLIKQGIKTRWRIKRRGDFNCPVLSRINQ